MRVGLERQALAEPERKLFVVWGSRRNGHRYGLLQMYDSPLPPQATYASIYNFSKCDFFVHVVAIFTWPERWSFKELLMYHCRLA